MTNNIIKIRKRVFELEAIQLLNTPKSIYDCQCFIEGTDKLDTSSSRSSSDRWDDYLHICDTRGGIPLKTLESDGETQLASFGDYIIKGIKGEFYPCGPDIFKELYEIIA